jgi:hypothetical protein
VACASIGYPGCFAGCSATPAATPAPAPATAPTLFCNRRKEDYASCLVSAGTFDNCTACSAAYLATAGDVDEEKCDELEAVHCGLARACPACAGCRDEQMKTANDCLTGLSCSLYCGSSWGSAPSPTRPYRPASGCGGLGWAFGAALASAVAGRLLQEAVFA